MPEPAYHSASASLLGGDPVRSAAAEAAIQKAERRLGVSLPPSLREWYSFENAIQILAEHSNADPPVLVKDFALLDWQSCRLLPIRHENQGVCVWAAHLDGSADPPVLVDVDTQGRQWHSLAPTFSAYVYACIWDYRRVFHRSALVQAQNRPISAATAEILGRRYRTQLSTYGWPGREQHRFVVDEESAILIWASPGQADWFVAGDAEVSLERALRAVWLLDGVGANLYECTDSGKAVLSKIRRKA